MQIKFDSLNRYEVPKFMLCNPGSVCVNGAPTRALGFLIDTSDEELVLNFNSLSELNMRVKYIRRDDPDTNKYVYDKFRAIQNRRLIFVEGVGYYLITGVTDGDDTEGTIYKDIHAQSCEAEIQNRRLPFVDGTYKFFNSGSSETPGLIETLVETLPLWTIGHIDDAVAEKYRTFEDVDETQNVLSFMLEDVQDAYECIFIFDIINRIINVYDQNNYVRPTNIHITKNDLISSIDINENSEDLYTALSVTGTDGISINPVNPLGSSVIYDFSHYTDWMTGALGSKVKTWQKQVSDAEPTYYSKNVEYYEYLEISNNYKMEVERLDAQITMYQRCRNNIVAESITASSTLVDGYNTEIIKYGGKAIVVYPEIADTLAEIDGYINECNQARATALAEQTALKDVMDAVLDDINTIHESLAFEKYFSAAELEELSNYIYEGSYTDDYIIITKDMTPEDRVKQMKDLYERSKHQLSRAASPTQEFNLDVENFLFVKEFEQWSEQLETGCLINAELGDNDVAKLFLSNITVNYDDQTLTMTFGNRFNKFDVKSLFDDMLGNISKSANTLDYIKEILYPIKKGELNQVKEALQTSRDLTMGEALSSTGEEVVIDGSGYTGKSKLNNGDYDPRQIKITGKSIVFTDDAWQSCKIAIGELVLGDGQTLYGINSKALIGDIIIGNELHILNNEGRDILTVIDDEIGQRVNIEITGVRNDISEIESSAADMASRLDAVESEEITEVTTTTGYTFNADGLTINREGEEITNRMDNTGMYVNRTDEEILSANHEGVNALNLTARQFLIIGTNSRLENYSNGVDTHRTACFLIESKEG